MKQPGKRPGKRLGKRPGKQSGRRSRTITIGLAASAAVAIVAAIVASIYIFGGKAAPDSSGSPGGTQCTVTVPTLATTGDGTLFTIDASASKATFTIDEVLFGQPNTVVGTTSAIAGQILVDESNPAKSQVGEIKIDLSTLVTDNDLRNHTLQGRILETGDPSNQYATFVAKSISGMPASVTVGQQVTFKITGDLTIHGVTKSETFDAQVKGVSAKQLTGEAQATVKYGDFGIAIPNVPSVTGVDDLVKLALSFTANAS